MGVRVVDGRVERGMRGWETWVRGLWVEEVMRDEGVGKRFVLSSVLLAWCVV